MLTSPTDAENLAPDEVLDCPDEPDDPDDPDDPDEVVGVVLLPTAVKLRVVSCSDNIGGFLG